MFQLRHKPNTGSHRHHGSGKITVGGDVFTTEIPLHEHNPDKFEQVQVAAPVPVPVSNIVQTNEVAPPPAKKKAKVVTPPPPIGVDDEEDDDADGEGTALANTQADDDEEGDGGPVTPADSEEEEDDEEDGGPAAAPAPVKPVKKPKPAKK